MIKYKAPNGNIILRKIRQFFWWCAGADPLLLKEGTYTDQIKMACLGGTIVSTAALAFIAGTYAFHTIFSTDIHSDISSLSYFFGAIWGLVIFNIDRFIVSSTPPKINIGWLSSLKQFLPRIIMGVVISLVISKPLELKIFEKDIELKIKQKENQELLAIRNGITEKIQQESQIILDQISEFEDKTTSYRKRRDYYDSLFSVEARIVTVGPRARAMREERDRAEASLQQVENDAQYINLKNEYKTLIGSIDVKTDEQLNTVQLGMRSLVNRLQLAHEISPTISWAITLVFIIIELTPIFFKLTMEKSPFDYQLFNRNEIIKQENSIDESGYIVKSKNSIFIQEKLDRERDQDNKNHQQILAEKQNAFEKDLMRKKEEAELKIKLKSDTNRLLIESENQSILANNLKFDLDVEQITSQVDKLLENQKFIEEKLHHDIEILKKLSKYSVDTELLKQAERKYLQVQSAKIKDNPIDEYLARVLKDGVAPSAQNHIDDDLIQGKKWKPGDSYVYTYAFTRDSIKNILKKEGLTVRPEIIESIFESKENQLLTDSKISQMRKNIDIFQWVNETDIYEHFEIDRQKLAALKDKKQNEIIELGKSKVLV